MRRGTSLEFHAGQGTLNINPKIVAAADPSAAPEPPPAAIVDPVADALLYLAAHHGRALSRDALLAGLPIDDGRLNVALFERAAQRAGLETEPVKRALLDIPALVLPAVLIMRDGSCRVLLELDTHAGTASVIDPSEPQDGRRRVSLRAVGRLPGLCVFCPPCACSGGARQRRRRHTPAALVLVGR